MEKQYDAIVIGAGNAGLACAAAMAINGLTVLVLEKNSVPGGSATSFRRGRFEFEAALHELASVGTKEDPGSVMRLFSSFGIDIDWQYEKNAFRVITDSYDATMPAGIEDFCREMERQVPGSFDSTLAAFKIAAKVGAGIEYLKGGEIDPKVLFNEHADFMRAVSHSVDECLDALGMPKKAQDIFKTYWPYLGAPTDKLDFAHYMIMVDSYIRKRPAMPHLRSHELSLALERVILNNGGEIFYNCPAKGILTKDGKAYGVVADGKEIYSRTVVANCFPDTAFEKLLPPDAVPERALKIAGARKLSSLFFSVYLGLNKSAEELGITDYSVFLFDSSDSGEQYERSASLDTTCMVVSNCLNCVIPDSSPEGTSTLFITTMLRDKAWGEVRPEDYKRQKNSFAKKLIEIYEKKMGVSVMPYIEEIVIATPATFARYLGTPCGTPYGYELSDWDTMLARIMNAKNEQVLEDLYFVGAHGERGDGYSTTYSNGNSVGARIVKGVKKNG
ncbi:MAG: NAD(P)/FAD-dependent oxidoreductase [Ruminococcaceae bacterium]|nr:NAD(P)/FAD-dependent oxidoreductase [Oscillospiraceae bacterium]